MNTPPSLTHPAARPTVLVLANFADMAERTARYAALLAAPLHAHLALLHLDVYPVLPLAAEPARQAQAGTPHYGHFGYLTGHGEAAPAPPTAHDGMAKLRPNLVPQRGHVVQNQDIEAVQEAHNGTEVAMRASYALDDPRYAGGDVYDLKDEQATR